MYVRQQRSRTAHPIYFRGGSTPDVVAIDQAITRAFLAYGRFNRTLCMSIEAPPAPAECLLTLPAHENQVLWSPKTAEEHSGCGAAYVLVGTGDTRFVDIRDAAAQAFQDMGLIELEGEPAPEPKFVGGFSFQPARTESALWTGFGDARFVLPRIAYTRNGQRAWLTLTAGARDLAGHAGRSCLAWQAAEALQTLHRPHAGTQPTLCDLALTETAGHAWSELVTGIRQEIAARRFEKAVAVQCTVVRGACLPAAALVLERLRKEAPDCVRFALSTRAGTFLGASPERLIKREGLRVWSEAIAGSIPGDDPKDIKSLLTNPKDGVEHGIVAREIRAVLEPLCDTFRAQGREVLQLSHLAHLRTRFAGVLKEPLHVLDLVSRLHPTPAVGGAPRAAALAWIAAHEQIDRGMYSGPFGAFDRAGNGEFVVAIRSGLLAAREAHLFAGAGIVEGSEVQSELHETRWKLRGLLSALGAA